MGILHGPKRPTSCSATPFTPWRWRASRSSRQCSVESSATAAIVILAFTLGFWVLDFAAATGPEWLKTLGGISPTQVLKAFERGLFPTGQSISLAALGLGLAVLAAAILPPGLAPQARRLRGVTSIAVLTVALAVASLISSAVDVSEDRRNSFNPADEAALTRMDQGLTITLHLTPEDSRALEYAANVLAKLKRIVPGLTAGDQQAGGSPALPRMRAMAVSSTTTLAVPPPAAPTARARFCPSFMNWPLCK